MNNKKIAVVGGGAAGLFAAIFAKKPETSVTLFEKNGRLGRKLYITGKGRCNMTNLCSVADALKNVVGNPRFLHGAFNAMPPDALTAAFNEWGLQTKVERGNRVFPASDKSADVIDALVGRVKAVGVEIRVNAPIREFVGEVRDGIAVGGFLVNGEYFDCVIIATGGLSYPSTGSTGDGYRFAQSFGHTVTPLYPSLVSLTSDAGFLADVVGLSLKNVGLSAFAEGEKKAVYNGFGEMLFTETGVSGPLVLSASRFLTDKPESKRYVSIDLKPALTRDRLDARVLRDFSANNAKILSNALYELLPRALVSVIISEAGIDGGKKVCDITRGERARLVETLKGLRLNITGDGGFGEAVVTNGGVSVKEVNPKTMESKLRKGLFFAGEVLDLDGFTGGFNLHIAFATGYAAGSSV